MQSSSIKNKFLNICVPLRLLLATIVAILPDKYLYIVSYIASFIILTNLVQYIRYMTGENRTGAFGQEIWWNNNRLVHIGFLTLLVYLIMNENQVYRYILFIDLIFGMGSFIDNHVK